ncbi:MAG: hypothetical protein WC997_02345 [Porticoccaceae bacterium]
MTRENPQDRTRDEILAALNSWRNAMRECDVQMEALSALVGLSPESPLPDAIGRLQGAYTEAVARLLGWCSDALCDWWLEHSFGDNPMCAGLGDEPLRTIDSNKALAQLIFDDLQRGGV